MAADNGDLPSFYRGWYCHELVEEVQDATANWFETPSHPDWISTKDFEATSESFYLLGAGRGPRDDADDKAAEDDLEEADDVIMWRASMPPSLQWLASEERVLIPTTRVSTKEERALFKSNYLRFPAPRGATASSDDRDGIDFSAFTLWWNYEVDAKEKGRDFTSGLFRKTAALLRLHYKERLRILNIASTIAAPAPIAEGATQDASIRDANLVLRGLLRNSERDDGHKKDPTLPSKRPRPSDEAEAGIRVRAERVVVKSNVALRAALPIVNVTQSTGSETAESKPKRCRHRGNEGTRDDPVCRRCGRKKVSDAIAVGKHGNRCTKTSASFCTVDPSLRIAGYPLAGYEAACR